MLLDYVPFGAVFIEEFVTNDVSADFFNPTPAAAYTAQVSSCRGEYYRGLLRGMATTSSCWTATLPTSASNSQGAWKDDRASSVPLPRQLRCGLSVW